MKRDKINLLETINHRKYNDIIVDNDCIDRFELELEQVIRRDTKVVALNSGTSAIHMALVMSGIVEGDYVLCQTFTYIATVAPVIYQKAIPIFIDSEEDTLNMCPKKLEEALLDLRAKRIKPKAIIIVHSYGVPADMDALVDIAEKYNIILIEDAAEAFGSIYKGSSCGIFGKYGIISFNNNKIISTLGGGALICNNLDEKKKAIYLSTHARDLTENFYHHKEIAFNYRIGVTAASLGLRELKRLENRIELKKQVHEFYEDVFDKIDNATLYSYSKKDSQSNYWLNVFTLNDNYDEKTISEIQNQFLKENIECRRVWQPLHCQPVFENVTSYKTGVSEKLFKNSLCLPSSSFLNDDDKERIKDACIKII